VRGAVPFGSFTVFRAARAAKTEENEMLSPNMYVQGGTEIVGADDDLDEILRAVAGETELVGAMNAMKPGLGSALQRLNKKRLIVGSSNDGRISDTALPMTGGNNAVAAAASITLVGTPLRNFKPRGFLIQTDGNLVTVESATIANQPQFASASGSTASDVFRRDTILPFAIDWDVIPMNQTLSVVAKNQHAATAAGIFGSAYGKYTQPG
jgi:hypothetical protein